MSTAERCQKYREKLKVTGKYEEYKRKINDTKSKYIAAQKAVVNQMSVDKKSVVIAKRREAVRNRVKKCREKKNHHKPMQLWAENFTAISKRWQRPSEKWSVFFPYPQQQ